MRLKNIIQIKKSMANKPMAMVVVLKNNANIANANSELGNKNSKIGHISFLSNL